MFNFLVCFLGEGSIECLFFFDGENDNMEIEVF